MTPTNTGRNERLTVAMFGIGGFGNQQLARLLGPENREHVDLVAAVDPSPEKCEHLAELKQRDVRIHESIDTYLTGPPAQLVIVTTPIHLHRDHVIQALGHGSHVFCEKPTAPTVQDVQAMADARDHYGRRVAIGFQWSYSDAVQRLKADIARGDLGRPLRFRTLVCWPRNASYYNRSNWAGRQQTDSGEWVLDSPINNATSHYLHNCLYLLGETREASAAPTRVQAELYRANDITNNDTAALRVHAGNDVEILFYTSHAVRTTRGPVFEYSFENATVTYDEDRNPNLRGRFSDGRTRDYGDPDATRDSLFSEIADCIRNDTAFACEIETSMPLVLTANLAQESSHGIGTFPAGAIHQTPDPPALTYVEGLESCLTQCYERCTLPSEDSDIAWATPGAVVSAEGYDAFPSDSA